MRRRDLLKSAGVLPFALSALAQNRYTADWASLDQRASPSWYTGAKFGIFIHWGVYSVPAFAPPNVKGETPYAEWYWNSLEKGRQTPGGNGTSRFHERNYGANFPYANFAPMFKAELFDPDQWADLFARSGARYVALTSKHHEGFTLWRSAEANKSWGRPWNAVDVGPKRDLVLELSEAGRRKGLHMGIYYSLYEWYNPLYLADRKRYVREHMIPQFKDVVNHVKPSIIFSDGEWEMDSADWQSPELLAWLFNESPVANEVVVDDRWGKDTRHKHGGYYTTEYTSGMQSSNHPWEESRGMGFSYGYNRMETLTDYHTDRELLMMLIDIVSRGGNLLLDIGPTGDGRIPVIMQERLVHIGEWLKANGEAIYDTHAWTQPRQWSTGNVPKLEEKEFRSEYNITNMVDEPPAGYARVDAFFTTKPGVLYAMLPRWPERQITLNDAPVGPNVQVSMLGLNETLPSKVAGNSLQIQVDPMLRSKIHDSHAYVLKITGLRGA
jgi:alpha-L-fucosidase